MRASASLLLAAIGAVVALGLGGVLLARRKIARDLAN